MKRPTLSSLVETRRWVIRITHNHVAFLDEWGNNGLDFTKPGVSTHFIVVALTLPKDKLPEAEQQVEIVRKRFFKSAPSNRRG